MARDALDPDPVPLTQLRNLAICRYTARNILLLRVLRWIEIAKLTKLWPQQLDESVPHPADVLAQQLGAKFLEPSSRVLPISAHGWTGSHNQARERKW